MAFVVQTCRSQCHNCGKRQWFVCPFPPNITIPYGQYYLTLELGPTYASACNALFSDFYQANLCTQSTTIYSYSTQLGETIRMYNYTLPYSTLCDGIPRFTDPGIKGKFVGISTRNFTSVHTITMKRCAYSTSQTTAKPSCTINQQDCVGLWSAYRSSYEKADSTWYSDNLLTISLASPPTSIVVNGKTTALPGAVVTPPPIVLHGDTYSALPGSGITYRISHASNPYGSVDLTPGGTLTAYWNVEDIQSDKLGPHCQYPDDMVYACDERIPCRVTAHHVSLMFFAPPSRSRDICANTSPGYDRSKQQYFSDFAKKGRRTALRDTGLRAGY